jgi:hypothetical protein
MKFAYADPPYLGCGRKHYADHHPDAADWDDPLTHHQLAGKLVDDYPDGWALSLTSTSLQMYLAHLPGDVRIGSWCKTWHQIRPTSVQYAWEPVIFRGGRKDPKRNPMVRDWIIGNATTRRGRPGTKPEEFNRWILDLLGYEEGDQLDDLFPGTHGMAAAVAQGVLTFEERHGD